MVCFHTSSFVRQLTVINDYDPITIVGQHCLILRFDSNVACEGMNVWLTFTPFFDVQ